MRRGCFGGFSQGAFSFALLPLFCLLCIRSWPGIVSYYEDAQSKEAEMPMEIERSSFFV
jgi:hypothetical protein